jgi:hypothetical protein
MHTDIPEVPDKNIRQMQIVVLALMLGVIMFGTITMLITWKRDPDNSTISFIAAGFAAFAIPMSFIIPAIVSSGLVKSAMAELKGDNSENLSKTVNKLSAAYQTKLIIGVAVLEGAAMFNLVANIIEAQSASLVIAGVLVLLMALLFPTPLAVENWVRRRFDDLQFSS